MNPKLDIGALAALCAIRDQGGVTRAADHLALSQSAVSHKIKRLEEGLGCTLLSRRPGAPRFTPEGERLLSYARRILGLHDEAVMSLGTEPLSGRLRLGVTEDTTGGRLSHILGRFTRLYPRVAVQASVGQSLAIAAQLDRGELDVAVMQVFAHERRPTDIVLSEDSLHWIKSPDLRLDWGRAIPFLAFDNDCFYRRWAMNAEPLPTHGFTTVLECASLAGILSAVQSGLGVTLLNARHLTPAIEVMSEGFPAAPHIAYVIRVGDKARSPAVRTLVEEIASIADSGHPDRVI